VRGAAETHETSSPSMDISKASNFERFVFDLVGRDAVRVRELFAVRLAQGGTFSLGAAERDRLPGFGFASGRSTHADRVATIRSVFDGCGVTIDPHTADGVKVAREQQEPGVPMIVLETAQPAKFAATIVEALGTEPARPAAQQGIEALPRRCVVMAADAGVKVIGFSGWSGSGKTTLVERVIAGLVMAGQRVSVVKHAHHDFDIDYPGKDTWRHRQAGAFEVVIASRRRLAKMREFAFEVQPTVHQLLAELVDCDWALVEGFKNADLLKIEVWRDALGKPVRYPDDPFIVAIATDSPQRLPQPTALPVLDLNAPDAVADFLLETAARYEYRAPEDWLADADAGGGADAAAPGRPSAA
jgi:molybdopterin-guanine dinucleotide biosynthesis protein B